VAKQRFKVKIGVEAVDLGNDAYDKSNPTENTEGLTENEALGSRSKKVFSVSTICKTVKHQLVNVAKISASLQIVHAV
jgi:hypothetical protein